MEPIHWILLDTETTGFAKPIFVVDLKYHSIHDAFQELSEVSRIRELFVGFQKHLFEREA